MQLAPDHLWPLQAIVAQTVTIWHAMTGVVLLQVDLTLHGHHHSYQRSCPFYKGQCQPDNEDGSASAPVHVVIGHAGAGLCFNTEPEKPAHFEVVDVDWGYSRIEANGTHLHMEVVRDANAEIMDSFVLIKPGAEAPQVPGPLSNLFKAIGMMRWPLEPMLFKLKGS